MAMKLYQPDITEARGTFMSETFFRERIELSKSLPPDVVRDLCDGVTTLGYPGGNIVYLCVFVPSIEEARKVLGRKESFLREKGYIKPYA